MVKSVVECQRNKAIFEAHASDKGDFMKLSQKYLEMFLNIQLDIHKKRSPLLTKLKDKMNNKIKKLNMRLSNINI